MFSLLLVFFRNTYLEFWGVTLAVFLMSISALFYIMLGQFLFSKLLQAGADLGLLPAARPLRVPRAADRHRHRVAAGRRGPVYRTMFLEEIGKDYVRTARAKGLSETVVLFRHVLRNALLPILTAPWRCCRCCSSAR